MSSALRESTLKDKLDTLECHFTWNLASSSYKLRRTKEKVEDIGFDEENRWLGPIYNLLGFIHFRLNSTDEVSSFFSRAAEAFGQLRRSERGPWLMVCYANLAWYHYHQEEEAESQFYLSEVEALMKEYPSESEAELHPEICAEKAWVLRNTSEAPLSIYTDYLQRAVEMQPEMTEWQTAYMLYEAKRSKGEDYMVKLKEAVETVPENLELAALYLKKRVLKGEKVEDEVESLAEKILSKPMRTYSGFRIILDCYKSFGAVDRAITMAEKLLEKHPDQRYPKRCAALCYKWKIINTKNSHPTQGMIERAISLHQQVIDEYPNSSLLKKTDLASIYALTGYDPEKGEEIFQQLLEKDLEPAEKQVLYNAYSRYLFFSRGDSHASIDYHKKVVKIQLKSFFRDNSITELKKCIDREKSPEKKRELSEFLREHTDEEERSKHGIE